MEMSGTSGTLQFWFNPLSSKHSNIPNSTIEHVLTVRYKKTTLTLKYPMWYLFDYTIESVPRKCILKWWTHLRTGSWWMSHHSLVALSEFCLTLRLSRVETTNNGTACRLYCCFYPTLPLYCWPNLVLISQEGVKLFNFNLNMDMDIMDHNLWTIYSAQSESRLVTSLWPRRDDSIISTSRI